MERIKAYDIAILAILTTLALVLSLFDNMLSLLIPIPLPGFKIGVANLVTLFLVMYFSLPKALCVVFLRCFISSMYSGGVTVFLISLSGGILSVLAMYFIKYVLKENVSQIGISIFGAACHNLGQVIMVILLLMSPSYIFYLPILLIVSLVTGFVIGFVGLHTYPRIAKFTKLKLSK
ncbi:MAG: Gx transporter family protein [Clostridia bacterium]|nr:Gx transporter family protein [Clostridia bacterium]